MCRRRPGGAAKGLDFGAGNYTRPGTNSEFHLVDDRITGHKLASVDFAAALPPTTITARDTLFDRFALTRDSSGTLLVICAAGGVGTAIDEPEGLDTLPLKARCRSWHWS